MLVCGWEFYFNEIALECLTAVGFSMQKKFDRFEYKSKPNE